MEINYHELLLQDIESMLENFDLNKEQIETATNINLNNEENKTAPNIGLNGIEKKSCKYQFK